MVNISTAELLGLICVMTVVVVFSLIPGSLGLYEVGITVFLIKVGQTAALAQAGSLALRCYSILMLFIGLIHYILWQMRQKREPSLSGATPAEPAPMTSTQ